MAGGHRSPRADPSAAGPAAASRRPACRRKRPARARCPDDRCRRRDHRLVVDRAVFIDLFDVLVASPAAGRTGRRRHPSAGNTSPAIGSWRTRSSRRRSLDGVVALDGLGTGAMACGTLLCHKPRDRGGAARRRASGNWCWRHSGSRRRNCGRLWRRGSVRDLALGFVRTGGVRWFAVALLRAAGRCGRGVRDWRPRLAPPADGRRGAIEPATGVGAWRWRGRFRRLRGLRQVRRRLVQRRWRARYRRSARARGWMTGR